LPNRKARDGRLGSRANDKAGITPGLYVARSDFALVLFLFLFKNGGCIRPSFVNSSGYRTGLSA
jgi:hypothetical protein